MATIATNAVVICSTIKSYFHLEMTSVSANKSYKENVQKIKIRNI